MAAAVRAEDVLGELQHSLAYIIRKRDAEVVFKLQPLLQEFVYNFLGSLALPLVYYTHGRAGAVNRSYLGTTNAVFWGQIINTTAFIASMVLYLVFNGTPGYDVSFFEVLSMVILNTLRCMTIAVKYSTYTYAELCELDARVIPGDVRNEKLVLIGWRHPSERLLFFEMERAITRTCPHIAKHNIVFPDVRTRDATLYQMIDCLRTFNSFELCTHMTYEQEWADHKGCEVCGTAIPQTLNPVEVYLKYISPTVERSMADPQWVPAAPPNGHGARASMMSSDISALASQLMQTIPGAASTAGPGTPHTGTYVKAHIPQPLLPSIPAKLLLWHIIYESHFRPSPFPMGWTVTFAVFAFAAMPFVIRGAAGAFASLSIPALVTLMLLLQQNIFYMFTTFSFVCIGVLASTRRQKTALLLHKLLDYNATLAMRMHDCEPSNAAVGEIDAELDLPVAADATAFQVGARAGDTVSVIPNDDTSTIAARQYFRRIAPPTCAVGDESMVPFAGAEAHFDTGSLAKVRLAEDGQTVIPVHSSTRVSLNAPADGVRPADDTRDTGERDDRRTSVAGSTAAVAAGRQRAASVVESELRLARVANVIRVLKSVGVKPSGSFAMPTASHMDLHPVADDETFAPIIARAYSRKPSQGASSSQRMGHSKYAPGPTGKPRLALPAASPPPASPPMASPEHAPSAGVPASRWSGLRQRASAQLAGGSSATVVPIMDEDAPLVNGTSGHANGSSTAGASTAGDPSGDAGSRGGADARRMSQLGASRRLAMVSQRVRNTMVERYVLLSPDQIDRHILGPSTLHVTIPLMYPTNVMAWSHVFHAAMDTGRSYDFRISAFTAFFFTYVLLTTAFLFIITSVHVDRTTQTFVVIALAGYEQLAFGGMLVAQVVLGASINQLAVAHQRRLNKIESLTYEYLVTSVVAVPAHVRDRLLQTKKIAAAAVEAIRIQDMLSPTRVMFIPAKFGLLGTMASLTLSGAVALYRAVIGLG